MGEAFRCGVCFGQRGAGYINLVASTFQNEPQLCTPSPLQFSPLSPPPSHRRPLFLQLKHQQAARPIALVQANGDINSPVDSRAVSSYIVCQSPRCQHPIRHPQLTPGPRFDPRAVIVINHWPSAPIKDRLS